MNELFDSQQIQENDGKNIILNQEISILENNNRRNEIENNFVKNNIL